MTEIKCKRACISRNSKNVCIQDTIYNNEGGCSNFRARITDCRKCIHAPSFVKELSRDEIVKSNLNFSCFANHTVVSTYIYELCCYDYKEQGGN